MGGPIRTPTFDRLAKNGLTYIELPRQRLCSPTRTALLTGRNSTSTAWPASRARAPLIPATPASARDRPHGRQDAAAAGATAPAYFGKCNEAPAYEVNVSGPFDRWPTRSGFDKFYGYIAGEQSLFHPSLIDGTTWHRHAARTPSYHFNTDMTNKAIAWMQATRSLTPDRPFLMYYAQSASHPPHTPPPSWLAKDLYKGEFDQGWDSFREEILAAADQDGHRAARHQARREPGVGAALG